MNCTCGLTSNTSSRDELRDITYLFYIAYACIKGNIACQERPIIEGGTAVFSACVV